MKKTRFPIINRTTKVKIAIIDFVLVYGTISILKFFAFSSQIGSTISNNQIIASTPLSNYPLSAPSNKTFEFLILEWALILLIYIFIPLLKNGRTIGAMVQKTIVHRCDNKSINIFSVFLRHANMILIYGGIVTITFFIDNKVVMLYPSVFINNLDAIFEYKFLGTKNTIMILSTILSLFPLLGWVFSYFEKNQQTLCERLSKQIYVSKSKYHDSEIELIMIEENKE